MIFGECQGFLLLLLFCCLCFPWRKENFPLSERKVIRGWDKKEEVWRELKKGYNGELARLQNSGSRFLPNCLSNGYTVAGQIGDQVKGHLLPHPSSSGSERSEWRLIKILNVWQRIPGQKWVRRVGAWGVLLFQSNPGHLPESSRDWGQNYTSS